MNSGKTIFSQLMDFLSPYEFRQCVQHYNGSYKIKSFSCWDQFLCMTFAQLTYRESLRDAALEPSSQGLTNLYRSVAAEVARGLLLRIDHGSQYLSDHFVNQVRFWGIKPCFAFVEQPQTNRVVERFNRTLKEKAIYGKVLQNIEEVGRAVGKFVEDYNAEWRVGGTHSRRFTPPGLIAQRRRRQTRTLKSGISKPGYAEHLSI